MRPVLAGLAIAGILLIILGAVISTNWLILIGVSALVISIVMRALALPATRHKR
jgi:hypothetical protein